MSRFALTTAALISAALLAAAAPASAQQAPGVSLPQALSAGALQRQVLPRRQAEVSGDFVRLGDLFTGLGPAGETVVAYAPAAGESMVFDHRRLEALGAEHGVTWQTVGDAPAQVIVRRVTDSVGQDQIRDALRNALIAQGASPTSEVELSGTVRGVAVPAGAANPVGVSEVALDSRSGRFTATVEMPAGDPHATRQRVSGQVFDTLEVPVVVRPINRDGVITDADIDWVKVRADRVQPGTATEIGEVVGMATRRPLRVGEPLRVRDLARPVLVARNELVTMVLRNDFMTLTTRGRALEDGAIGDTVRIRNERSNKTVLGRVVDARTVVVDGTQNSAAVMQ